MAGDIRFTDEGLVFEGHTRFISDANEVSSQGPLAGFSFQDRNNFLPVDGPGLRYVWYCSDKKARLYSGSDMITVEWVNNQPSFKIGGTDVMVAINSLMSTVASLQAEVKQLQAKVDPPVITPDNPLLHPLPVFKK